MRKLQLFFMMVLLAILPACGAAGGPRPPGPPDQDPPLISTPPDPLPWQTMPLTDVRTGETFTLADFSGKTVIVEPMAVWCPLCQKQQEHLKRALDNLDSEQVVAVSLGVDPRETEEKLQAFAEDEGYTWYFALSSTRLSGVLEQTFGPQILSPTSTPIIIIYPDGHFELTEFGLKEWENLVALVEREGS